MEDHLLGSLLGQYRIVATVGQGGMGAVYKAYQPALDRYVAIKVVTPQLADDADSPARFKRAPSPGLSTPISFRSTTSVNKTTFRSSSCR